MTRLLPLAALVLALTGCGTARNFTHTEEGGQPLEVYGGVNNAVDAIKNGYDVELAYTWPLRVADVGFSAVGDTLTLPITVAVAVSRAIDAYCVARKKQAEVDEFLADAPKMGDTHPYRKVLSSGRMTPEYIHGGIID